MGGKAKNKKMSAHVLAGKPNPKLSKAPGPKEETLELTLFTDQIEMLVFFIILAISRSIYYLTMHPSLAGGDSGELMAQAVEFGAAHPPSYPLLTIIGFIFNKLIPWGTPVLRLNTLATILSGLSNSMIYLSVKQASNNNPAAVLTALWCGFSRLHWTWSLHYEVFSLNNLLVGVIILSMVKFSKERTSVGIIRGAKVCAVMCSLAMSNQHTFILIIAPGAVWVLISLLQKGVTDIKVLATIALHSLAGLLIYLQIPISATGISRLSLKDQSSFTSSLASLPAHVLRDQYGTSRLSLELDDVTYPLYLWFKFNINQWFTNATSDFTPAIWAIAAATVVFSIKCTVKTSKEFNPLVRTMIKSYGNPMNTSSSGVIHLLTAMLAVYIGEYLHTAPQRRSTPESRYRRSIYGRNVS